MRLIAVLPAIAFLTVTAAAQASFPTLAPDALAGTGATQACLPEVEGRARCGVFRVFEDRVARAGRTIDLHFVVLDALDSAARAPDVIIPFGGGPGEAMVDAGAFVARDFRRMRRTRDVLLVDLRGVGRSGGLDCDVPFPRGLRSRFGAIFPTDHVERCREALERRARLDLYTTALTVDDLEELRRWLGYRTVDLLGVSYGTRVSQEYMRRHPAAVRVAVLNGVTPLDRQTYVQTGAYLQRALDLYVAECEANATCRTRYPRFRAQLAALMARLRSAPVEVDAQGERVPFSAGDLGYVLRGLLYARARDIPRYVEQASAGDFSELVTYYLQRTRWIGEAGGATGNHFSVLCAEDIAPVTDADVTRASAGTFLGSHLIDGYRAACRAWPHARLPASHFRPVRSAVPTLLLSGGRDPVTPPSGAEHVARGLSRSVHVVVPDGGHGVGGPCIEAMMVRLVEDGSLRKVRRNCPR